MQGRKSVDITRSRKRYISDETMASSQLLEPERSLWWEGFVEEIGFEPEVKESGSYVW